jgi:F-type H+-transporting ATPase subunit gamma
MPSLRDIRRRIRSIKNTAQITRAMEMVAASRMRRAQQRVAASRPYSEAMRSLISDLAALPRGAEALHPLLVQRPIDTVGIVMLTSDRGLAGSLNTNVIRRASQLILEVVEERKLEVELITVGRKGQDFMARRGHKLLGTFTQLGDQPAYADIIGIARVIMDSYGKEVMDECWLVYPKFISTLVQRPTVEQLLPIQGILKEAKQDGEEAAPTRPVDYIYEPDPVEILNQLLPRYVEVSIYQAVLETIASEQSARMIAMRNATENANDLVESLTLSYNKARQAAITMEVTEIASAAEALGAGR